jgi:hypothetical protein
MFRQYALGIGATCEQRHVGVPPDHIDGAFEILSVAGRHLLREENDLVFGKILEHPEPDLLTKGMPAKISAALHEDGSGSNPGRHGVPVIALGRTFISDWDPQLGQKPLLAEPNRVLAAIRRIRKIHESGAAITRISESIAQLFGGGRQDRSPSSLPGTTRFPASEATDPVHPGRV